MNLNDLLPTTMGVCASLLLFVQFLELIFFWSFSAFVIRHFWKASVLRSIMEKQGIFGPRLEINFDLNNGKRTMKKIHHDVLGHIFPRMKLNCRTFGNVHLNWWFREPRIVIAEPNLIRDIVMKKADHFSKSPSLNDFSVDVFYNSLIYVSGKSWANQRKVLAPTFYADKVKGMVEGMVSTTSEFMDKWESLVGEGDKEIEVRDEFMKLNLHIISKAAFNTTIEENKAKDIIRCVTTLLQKRRSEVDWSWLPFAWLIPTEVRIQMWRLRRSLGRLVREQVNNCKQSRGSSYGKDPVGILLEHAQTNTISQETLIAECMAIYANGFITLTPLLSFTVLMLAMYPSWQQKAREEVDSVLHGNKIDAESISKLHIVEMIFRETARLYPPMPFVTRMCIKDTMLGDLFIPKGLGVTVPIFAVHHDPNLWGENASDFNPLRFENGTAAAGNHPLAFMPFSFGLRTCIGRSYAEMQIKVVIASILQRFQIKLSPNYRHNPIFSGPILPKHGMPVILKAINHVAK